MKPEVLRLARIIIGPYTQLPPASDFSQEELADVRLGWNDERSGLAQRGAAAVAKAEIEWAVSRWHATVANRPLRNANRRALDDTWRQVIRHFGGDPLALLGPDHDTIVADSPELFRDKERDTPAPLKCIVYPSHMGGYKYGYFRADEVWITSHVLYPTPQSAHDAFEARFPAPSQAETLKAFQKEPLGTPYIEQHGKGATAIFAQSVYDSEAHQYHQVLPGVVVTLDVDGAMLSVGVEDLNADHSDTQESLRLSLDPPALNYFDWGRRGYDAK